MTSYYVIYGTALFGPYKSWVGAYFAGLEIFGFGGWYIVGGREKKNKTRTNLCLLIAILGFLSLPSCCPKGWEHVHESQRDTIYVAKRDSVFFYDRDSVFVKEKGDTVYKYVEKWRWRDRWHTDTLYKEKVDSVAYEVVKEVPVEKPLSGVKSFKLKAFWVLILLCVIGFRKELVALIKKII